MLLWNKCLKVLLSPAFQLTSTATDPSLGFTVVSCFVSPNSNPSVASDYMLIENVCPKDDSVVLHPQKDFPTGGVSGNSGRRKAFSFNFSSKLNKSLLFLHCEMSLCSKRSHGSQSLPAVCSRFLLLSGSFFFSFPVSLLLLNKPSTVISERVRHVSLVFVEEVAAIWILADPEPRSLKAPVLGGGKKQNKKNTVKTPCHPIFFSSFCYLSRIRKKKSVKCFARGHADIFRVILKLSLSSCPSFLRSACSRASHATLSPLTAS